MVAGSVASSYHGQPRTTVDVDLVIEPTADQLENFLAQVEAKYYVSRDAARQALQARSMFNVIDFGGGWKADLIVRKNRPFSLEEFGRRQIVVMHGRTLPMASAEDVMLTKLEWDRISPSERQFRDALQIVQTQGSKLDEAYLKHWAVALGVQDRLAEVLAKARMAPTGEQGQQAKDSPG
jgi:hypothetical protein